MRLLDYVRRLHEVAAILHRWLASLAALDDQSRERIARYADEVAATLGRATVAVARLETTPDDRRAALEALREFGRIRGYVETIVSVLRHHLDGRKVAGVKRRLDQLAPECVDVASTPRQRAALAGRLAAAEGYFRALADGLRT